MTDQHTTAAELALLKILGDRLKAARAEVAERVATWRPKDRAAAVLPGDVEIGSVTLVSGRSRARIADEAAFVAWVERTHPEEIETVTITRPDPEFVERLLSAARQLGDPVDAATGETVPGLVVDQGDPYPLVKLAADAASLVAAAWQDGTLADLTARLLRPALPGADERPHTTATRTNGDPGMPPRAADQTRPDQP